MIIDRFFFQKYQERRDFRMDDRNLAKERKTLGILGGMGPEATGVLYDRITGHTVASKDQDHLDIWIYSHAGLPDRTECILKGEDEKMRSMLREDTEHMISIGCSYLAVPCNTCHYFGDVFREFHDITFIDMIDETARFICGKGISKVGILATDGTNKAGLYEKALKDYGVNTMIPDEKHQEMLMGLIYQEIKKGLKGDPEHFSPVVQYLEQEGCEAVILGCTELSVYAETYRLTDSFYVDALDVLARRCVELCGGIWHD